MFSKTSSVSFLKYGEVFSESETMSDYHENNFFITVQDTNINRFLQASDDVYLKSIEGICMLVVTKNINSENYDTFVIHRTVKINKGTLFNFITLGNEAKIELAFIPGTIIQNLFFKGTFAYDRMRPSIQVKELIAYYYNIRSSNYNFPGESDNYWEITFVDNGKLHTTINGQEYTLSSNQLIIYGPGQYHKQQTQNESCSYLTIIFDLNIREKYKKAITDRVFDIDYEMRKSIEAFVQSNDFNHAYDVDMMIISVEKLIVDLLRSTSKSHHKNAGTPMQQKFENELLNEILLYINENIYTSFNVEELCETFAISRSSLQSLFRNLLNIAPKEYISNLKLEKSKMLIKESKYSISEIASILGFSSIHYFSRRFKQKFGISPTEYGNKII